MIWFVCPFPGIMKDFYARVTVMVTGLCFVGTVTNPSRKSSLSLHQQDGDLLANWSSTRHTSQKTDTVDRNSYFFRVLFQPHTKERHTNHLDRTNHRLSKVTLSCLAHLRALEMLNLGDDVIHSLCLDLSLPSSSRQKRHRSRFRGRHPRLKVLLLQRNQLGPTPKGEHFERLGEAEKEYVGN